MPDTPNPNPNSSPSAAPAPWQRLSVSLIGAMLLMTLIMALSMVAVSNYSVQRQIASFPPEVRQQMERDKDRATLPTPAIGARGPASALPGQPAPRAPRLSRLERFRRDLINNLIWAVSIASVLGVGIGALLTRRIVRPIEEVSRAAMLVARGDLSARATLHSSNAEMTGLTQNFNQMASTLDTLERERRDLIADIAHELRTPLAVVQARLDAFEDGVLQPTPTELALIGAQVELLTRLVSDLRTLSLADAGRLALQLAPLDLSALAGRISRSYASKAQASGRTLNTDLTDDELPVEADRDRLGQVLINLLENAVRYTPEGSTITVSTRQEGQWAVLCVLDDGVGFAPESLPKIFSRFYRPDQSRSRELGGSGLGLAIVAALVQAHGGQVTARNRKGGGAEIEIRLPLLSDDKNADTDELLSTE